jgi:hypothetical protein
MGNFESVSLRGVKWIGNCINQVYIWWTPYKDNVDYITHNFIKDKKSEILAADNPKGVGEVVGIKKEKFHLDKQAKQLYKKLSEYDQSLVDDLLSRRNY